MLWQEYKESQGKGYQYSRFCQLCRAWEKKLDTTRAGLFEPIERPALKPLPTEPFIFGEWKKALANIDYHIEIERDYYSVPCGRRRSGAAR